MAALAAVAALARVSALPAVLAAAVLCATGRRRRDGLVPLLAAAVAAGWFYVRNTSRYGDPTGGGYLLDLLDRPRRSSLVGVASDPGFWSQITADAWGRFAALPGPLEPLLAAAATACLVWQVRRTPTVPWLVLSGYAVWWCWPWCGSTPPAAARTGATCTRCCSSPVRRWAPRRPGCAWRRRSAWSCSSSPA